MKTIPVDLDVYNHLVARGLGDGRTATDVLRTLLRRSIDVDDEMYDYILSLADEIGESASSILRRELGLASAPSEPGPPAPAPGVLEFRILAGTGAGPWNSRATMIVGRVGQTLRVHNDDSVAHRLHTPGQPFAHPSADIQPATSADYLLQSAFTPSSGDTSLLHDHAFGPAAGFWLTVTPA